MDVGGWLRNLGLEQYEAAFRDNAINEKVLPSLTAEDLKDLGVGLVGHRRALLDAIPALRADLNSKAPATPSGLTRFYGACTRTGRRAPPRSVMFCDPADSTGATGKRCAPAARQAARYPKASFTGLG